MAQLQAVRARFEEQLFVSISAEEQQAVRQVLTHIQGNLHTLMAEREARR